MFFVIKTNNVCKYKSQYALLNKNPLVFLKTFLLNRIILSTARFSIDLQIGIIHLVSTQNFPKNLHFATPDRHTYVCISGGKKC